MAGTSSYLSDFLNRIEIFSDLTPAEITHIVPHLRSVDLEPDEWLFRQGDPGNELFLVERGKVTISVKRSDDKDMELAVFEDGSFFGEMSIIDGEPRSAGCRSDSSSKLMSLRGDDFHALKADHPETVFKIMRKMLLATQGRLWNTNAFLSDLVQWGEAARKRAITDELTGLYNRRYLDETLETMVDNSRATGTKISLVMVDLDHFGSINDQYSQAVGDEVLKEVVQVFTATLRKNDVAARYGGDEFNIIFPDTDAKEAQKICEKICKKVASLDVLIGRGGSIERVTTSQGIATYPENANTTQILREAADAALYEAKEAGRNCVVHATSVSSERSEQ